MKWRRSGWVLAAAMALGGIAGHAELSEWLRNTEATGPLREAFFRLVFLPSGPVLARKPPRETTPELSKLIAASSSETSLYGLRAQEEEMQLDFTRAEADWKKFAQLSQDRAAGHIALADFYRRRLRPRDEVQALAEAAQTPSLDSERLAAVAQQRSWQVFQRIFAVIEAHQLPVALTMVQYRAWMVRYPQESSVPKQYFQYLLANRQFPAAERQIAAYQKAFGSDDVFPVEARATLAYRRGSINEALAQYDRAFRPLWPPDLVQAYFRTLGDAHRLREFLDRARAVAAANPEDLNAAARIFYYHQQQGNLPAARRALIEYRLRKEARRASWKADELLTLAKLSEAVHDYNEAARNYFALYSLPGADLGSSERALAGLTGVLLEAPEQPIRFGAGDLSLYRDVATLDPYPGFLNGILSLVLNSTEPARQYAEEEVKSVAYFHRTKAAELLALFDSRFPQSPQRRELHARLIETYATYGASEGVIQHGREFLAAFPGAPQRTRVALLMANALARRGRVQEEFAVYDALLGELAAASGGVPLGGGETTDLPLAPQIAQAPAVTNFRAAAFQAPGQQVPSTVRSPEYARVLDRYLARLVSLKRIPEALALYRREVDHNPSDPGLYERLAAFLDQNRMGVEVEQVYRRAMQRFPDRSWHHKLARWYLRRKRAAEFDGLTREFVRVFSGTELEAYFQNVVAREAIDPVIYRQVNLYAHERFPHNLVFVRNLLGAYQRTGTYDAAAWERLLKIHWFYADDIRARYFEHLSRTSRLAAELQAVKTSKVADSLPAVQFVAEAEVWQSHFEAAARALHKLATEYPGDVPQGRRAAAVHRSIAYMDPQQTTAAVAIEENLSRYDPGNRETLARLGEVYADRGMLSRARPYWNRMAQLEPGNQDGYLEAATVLWDYFQFDDALRQIAEGRKKLHQVALYAYQAGAIYESKREYRRAAEEYLQGALSIEGASPARNRLLVLARRPTHRAVVEEITSRAASGENPRVAAVALRVAVLEAQERREDLEKFLAPLAERSSSRELLDLVSRTAERQAFERVRERSLERQMAISADRIERMQLRLALMRLYEGARDVRRARQVVEALYSENPNILGVVRAAVDFYWRNKMSAEAVQTLTRAAGAAHPTLARQFTFEAARKATDTGEYAQARELLERLLQDDPFHAECLAAIADTYARAGDDRGLRDFDLAKIQALRDAPLDADERTARVAALRRGLILALTRLKDPAGAVDQYIEIINRFPDDEGLIQEAGLYAIRQNQRKRLEAYYQKAVADSPRDFRWPAVLARLETHFEDFPAAIAAYGRATEVRPDRTDLHAARAALEERLMRFDEAARSYAQLYDLAYRDPHWMEKVAEIRARQGQSQAAVEALRRALVEGRPERAENLFRMARRLESWNLLAPAREYAERGVERAGRNLLADADYALGAQIYARVMTRLRIHEKAFARLQQASQALPADQAQWAAARAFTEMGAAMKRYFTPEDKALFVAFLEKQKPAQSRAVAALVPIAESAGLGELEARWRYESLMARPGTPEAQMHYSRLVELQKRRMQFEELGKQLEAYWNVVPKQGNEAVVLDQAAESYRASGNQQAELRVLALRQQRYGTGGNERERYFELLLALDRQRLLALAANGGAEMRNAAAEFALGSGDRDLAQQAVAARGRGLAPVWTRAYTALAGLYYSDATPAVSAAFRSALGTGTIGERVGKPVDRGQQIAGDTWFYYGSRYGEYAAATKQGDPEDYLPAMLEGTPGRAEAYFTLADFYRDRRDWAQALADYGHGLELDPLRGDAHDRAALALWEQGQQKEAIARWKASFAAFHRLQEQRRLPPEFWRDVRAALEHVGARQLLPEVRPEADRLLRAYIRRNGSYQIEPLVRGAMAAARDPGTGIAWILDLAHATNELSFLQSIVPARWIPKDGREALLRRIVVLAGEQAAQSHGEAQRFAEQTLRSWQVQLATHLLDTGKPERAQEVLEAMPEEARLALAYQVAPLDIRMAAQNKRLDALLERYGREPEKAPSLDVARNAATALRKSGDDVSARHVLEFVYTRELENRNFSAANFLGLAELRLETGDAGAALALLRRMNLVAGEPYEYLAPAATLFERFHRNTEAAEFWSARARGVPWDFEARTKLGGAALAAVEAAMDAAYETRVNAALALGRTRSSAAGTGSAELDLLARGAAANLASVEQPHFFYARFEVAQHVTDPATRLRLLLAAIALDSDSRPARLATFRAAAAAEKHQLAVSAVEPLLERGGLRYWLQRPEREQGEDSEESTYFRQQFLAQAGLSETEPKSVARELAASYEKLGRLRVAVLFYRIAEVDQKVEALRATIERRAEALARRPAVTENLEQPRLVRPRLEGVQAQ